MLEFHSFEDVLDFAILQEKAAQVFYQKLSTEVTDPEVRQFYLSLVKEESCHEKQLRALKQHSYILTEPDLTALRDSGYLQAMPVKPDITLREAIQYAWNKERSARMLYSLLADTIDRKDLSELFRSLAAQESEHAERFKKEYESLPAAEKG